MDTDMEPVYWASFCGNATEYDAFWSYSLTVNTSNPDLTLCFQRTVLTWPSICLLGLSAPVHLWATRARPSRCGVWDFSLINGVKTVVCVLMIIMSILMVSWVGRSVPDIGLYVTTADYVATSLQCFTLLLALLLIRWDFIKDDFASPWLPLYWLSSLIAGILQCRSNVIRQDKVGDAPSLPYFISYNIFFALLILQFLLTFVVDRPEQPKVKFKAGETQPLLSSSGSGVEEGQDTEGNSTARPCTHELVSFWSKLTFQWLTWDVIKGSRKTITFEMLYRLRVQERCKTLLKRFTDYYFTAVTHGERPAPAPAAPGRRKPLWRALFHCIKADFLLAVSLRLVSIPISYVNPQLLGLLIYFVETKDPHHWKGMLLAVLMLTSNFTLSLFVNNFLFHAFTAGMKARSLIDAIVYRKALRLSHSARKQTTMGQVVNLMSVDAHRIQEMCAYSTLLWTVPIMIALALFFLWWTIGPSCLAGLGVLLLFVPLNAVFLARRAYSLQQSQMMQKDQRFRLMNEVLSGMKVLKLYAWEPSFERKVLGYRKKELSTIRYVNYINAFGSMCWILTPYLVSLAIFTMYILVDEENVLTARKAFVTHALINLLHFPLSFLPLGVAKTTQGIASIRRVAQFLDLEELDNDGPEKDVSLDENRIEIVEGTFSWGTDEPVTLQGVDLRVPHGGLVAVVGPVGCGKSSLISAILGDMTKVSGQVKINGSVAYVPQQAWILHNSLKENILFGKPLTETKYNMIIKACDLEEDLAALPGRDDAEIGEKGINLSGGQKQRISLARAVYQDEDIYLLDDPLSAVDAHVGKHIFDQVIGPEGLLKDKTRVFVTHGITCLPLCDVIVVLQNGRITDIGRYDDLVKKKGTFTDIVRSFVEMEYQGEENEEKISRMLSMDGSETGSVSDSYEWEPSKSRIPRRLRSRNSWVSSVGSRKSILSDQEEALTKGARLVEEEREEEGSISLRVLMSYVKACGYVIMNFILWSHIFYITFQVLTYIWLARWTEDRPVNGTSDRDQVLFRLSVYGYLGIGQTLSALVEAFLLAQGCYTASYSLHERLLGGILRAPMAFFEKTPLGRIMNRFSKDLDIVDTNLPLFISQFLFAIAPILVTIILICYSTPIFAAVFVPLAIMYIILQRLYVTAVRQWKRIDLVRHSPLYMHFDESVVGASSIHAYGKEQEFVDKCDRLIDESQRPCFMLITANRWCSLVMECIGAGVVFFACLFAVLDRDNIGPGLAGLSVSFALQVTEYMNAVLRTLSELEKYAVSVERIDEYINTESEAAWHVKEKQPAASWPEVGAVQFSDYSMRYRPGLGFALRHIDCYIKPGEKIGIVGRTGAGKSSLALALFRLTEPESGGIYIDGTNILEIGLHDLRRKVSIIPQEPVVFSGTLRSNLDPFNRYNDLEIWQALLHSHLQVFVSDVNEGLQYECGENGEALSIGQKQLLCLARALLRKSKILVLDEATAAVDFETDSLIQTTIREKFKHCTVLTVAHRIHTILDYDRIMVLDQGRIIEVGSPRHLLSKKGLFYAMAKDAEVI